MGIDQETYPVVAILPLVQVAWADGTIQSDERELIMHVASRSLEINETGMILLENWLRYRPSDAYLQAGIEVLSALAKKTSWRLVSLNTLNDVVGFSWDVAKAAGGLFGFGRVDTTEKEALSLIANHLKVANAKNIGELLMRSDGTIDSIQTAAIATEAEKKQLYDVDGIRDRGQHFSISPRSHGYAHLVFSGTDGSMSHPVGNQVMYIGRSTECDIQLKYDERASDTHCSISKVADKWVLTDQESQNGTFVNSQQVSRRVLLGGERIQVGDTAFTFVLGPN